MFNPPRLRSLAPALVVVVALISACALQHNGLPMGGVDGSRDGDATRVDGDVPAPDGDACGDTSSDPANCGACGHVCATPSNATATCINGGCGMACSPGFAACDSDPANGCESSLQTPAHCGTCDTQCTGTQVCGMTAGGSTYGCVTTCPAAEMLCNGSCVDVHTDAQNCGTCGHACGALANGSSPCSAGMCGLICNPGFGNCDSTPGDGCESPLNTVTNCVACGVACPTAPHATSACAPTGCTLTCAVGFGNCDTMVANGCESALATDVANCGTCGHVCAAPDHGTAVCGSGICGFTCMAGYVMTGSGCMVATCGNRMLDSGETCDDGNTALGDGCNATCQLIAGPSDCPGIGPLAITHGTEVYAAAMPTVNHTACNGGSPGGSAPDQAYQLAIQAEGTLTITLSSMTAGYQGVLMVRSTCADPHTQSACSLFTGSTGTTSATLSVHLGETYYVLVDGQAGTAAPYTLTFNLP